MTGEMEEQVTWSDLGFSYGKMYPVHSAATGGETSKPCWRKLSTSQSRPFLYLDLRENGQRQEPLTVMGGLSLGELMMLNTGESPSAAVESRLSQILEDNPQEKYYLSAKACRGILRRAERRGKHLPKLLKQVLLMQSASGGGCDGGGKGALVQTEKSGTLGTGNDQTIFQSCITPWDCQSKRIFGTSGEAPTLQGGIGGGVNNPAIFCMGTQQGGAEIRTDDRAPTLTAAAGMSGNNQPVVALDMSHAYDVIRDCGEVFPTLQARIRTGGNQVPLTYRMNGFGDYRDANVASSCKQRDFKDSTDLVCAVDCRNCREGGEVNGTLQAKESGGQSLNLNNTVRQNMVVRRLTPLECTRLQGYPDGWVDIGDWTDEKGKKHKDADSPKYKALGNSIALPFWGWMLRRMARYLPEGATLGSLFDGIAGFPLIWERIHGKGTARWASEIEKFPMAVTKLRFPEEA